MLDNYSASCPYCGESIDLFIDYSIPVQEYTEDCSVCCQPMIVSVEYHGDGDASVSLRREDE